MFVRWAVEPAPVVGDVEEQRCPPATFKSDRDVGRLCVTSNVRQALLSDAINGEFGLWRELR